MTVETVDVLYTAHATSEGGRNGTALSGDGLVDVNLTVPKAMGGAGKAGATTPEDLFAAGYAACFHSALKVVAGAMKVDTTDSEVVADVNHFTP